MTKPPSPLLPQTQVSRPTFLRRVFNFKTLLFYLSIASLVLMIFAKLYPYFYIDLYFTLTLQKFHPFWFDSFMHLVTSLGNKKEEVTLTLAGGIFLLLIKKIKDATFLLISTAGAAAIADIIKTLIGRPRPDHTLILQVDKFIKNDSFPSGHVFFFMGFVGFLLFLTYSQMSRSWLRNILITVLALLLLLMGMSRIYLGAHWFSDTLGSYLIGMIWLYFMVYLYNNYR